MPGGQLINRDVEHDRYWRNITELDKVASMILATLYSGGNGQGASAQRNIGLRTVAVVSVNRTLIVATNALTDEQEPFVLKFEPTRGNQNWHYGESGLHKGDIAFHPISVIKNKLAGIEGAFSDVIFPKECSNPFNFHAEMALLQYMHEHAMTPENNEMGVSKPCCRYCAAVLRARRINFSFRHNDKVKTWAPPPFLNT